MNTEWSCEYCTKKYKTFTGFKKHKCKKKQKKQKKQKEENKTTRRDHSNNDILITKPKKHRKKKISPQIRFDVWKKYIGNKIEAKCFCCWKNRITPFTNNNTFHAGHIMSEANGGIISIGNLLPICSDCNKDMNATNWDEYIKISTNFCPRIYGEKIPQITQNKVKQIQKWYRSHYLQKKKKKIKQKKIKQKKGRKKIPHYQKPTQSFLYKIYN